MARRAATLAVNGDGPPPSTLAAQIVQNQTRSSAPHPNGQKATFAQLLHEILNNPAAAPETDVHVNVKLISVVLEAGLAPLAENNPFAEWDNLIPQAIDSIAVIEATIRRQPEVLFTPTTEDGPQLLLPVLARVSAVCGIAKCEDLPIGRLLNAMVGVLQASIDLWQSAQRIRDAIQDCLNETIAILESSSTLGSAFSLKLPPPTTVAALWPCSGQQIALPNGCQVTITDKASAFMLAMRLSTLNSLTQAARQESQLRLQKLFQPLTSDLQRTNQYQSSMTILLRLPSCLIVPASLIEGMSKVGPSQVEQIQIAVSLIRSLRSDTASCEDALLPSLIELANTDQFDTLHEDLRIAIATVVCKLVGPGDRPHRVAALDDALRQDNVMTDSEFLAAFKELTVMPGSHSNERPRRKRRRIGALDDQAANVHEIQRTAAMLSGSAPQNVDPADAMQTAANVYHTLPEEQKLAVWQGLAAMAPTQPDVALQTVTSLLAQVDAPQSKPLRVLSMLAFKACIENTTHAEYVDLGRSALGQMCLRSLYSSLRELRFAANQALGAFLRKDLPQDLKEANTKIALHHLRALSDRDETCEHDTLVGAWGQVAMACDSFELNLALLRLIDYIGHPNPLICGLAFSEVEKVASFRRQSLSDLFKPFWPTIAVSVIQDLQARPQKAQQLCDLLGVNLNQWLVQTQQDTVPTLVLLKKKNVLERIAEARGNTASVYDLCIKPKSNLAAIMTLLLVQTGPEFEEAAWACLTEVSPGFPSEDFPDVSSLVKKEATMIACHMLEYIGDQEAGRKSRAYQAFHVFANISERRHSNTKAHNKISKTVNEFFDNHILGIMTHFSDILESPQGMHTVQKKLRCLRAIGEMVAMVKNNVSIALPQIRAALQSSMEQRELLEVAFQLWLELIAVLDDEDLVLVLDQTFALILRHWQEMSPPLQGLVQEKIAEFVKMHNTLIFDNVMTIPSLSDIPVLAKLAGEIERLKSHEGVEVHCKAYVKRLQSESSIVVLQAMKELVPYLESHQDWIHGSVVSEQPATVLSDLVRALLDGTQKYSSASDETADLFGKAFGIIGCLDPNRVEATRKRRQMLVLSNFDKKNETIDWVIVLLEDVLVKAFKSVNNARAQGFLAYVIQELLRFCDFNDVAVLRPRASQLPTAQQKWASMPESVRITLTPFIRSRYVLSSVSNGKPPERTYPAFDPEQGHAHWLRSFVLDLIWKAKGENPQKFFPLLARVVRGHDLSIASFLLPYAVLNVVLGGTVREVEGISSEFRAVLSSKPGEPASQEITKLCSDTVFHVLDYMSTWLQEKKKQFAETRSVAYRTGHSPADFDEVMDANQIENIEKFLTSIPAEVIATQAVVCGSYSRALFHWEQYIRQKRELIPSKRPVRKGSDDQKLYDRLYNIYAQIDEPDGLEGISAHLQFLTEEQQALQHTKSGRWSAAQSWYEAELAKKPQDAKLENNLLRSLQETGQYAALLRYADSFLASRTTDTDAQAAKARLLPVLAEGEWMIGNLSSMRRRFADVPLGACDDFNLGVVKLLTSAAGADPAPLIADIRRRVTQAMNLASTSSVYASHDELRKLHVLYELEIFCNNGLNPDDIESELVSLDKRLAVLGSDVPSKQSILGLRRLVMEMNGFEKQGLGPTWLMSAKLARQSNNTQQAYNAVLRAAEFGETTAELEEARLLWRDGHQRHAIQRLQASIASGTFEPSAVDVSVTSNLSNPKAKQDTLSARAALLLAKWLDALGQSQMQEMTDKYQYSAIHFQRWEKGHYYLGKHYQKLLEAEKQLPKEKQPSRCRGGELTRLVIENLLRSVPFGNKYWHETIPKVLTLWLDLGVEASKTGRGEEQAWIEQRAKASAQATKQITKYFDRVPPFVFYTAIPQLISRITHPHKDVWNQIANILIRIASAYPSQALWSLLALAKATEPTRVSRGKEILDRLRDRKTGSKDLSSTDLRMIIVHGQKISDGLLQACEAHVEQRVTGVSLTKDLGFNMKLAPNPLVVPIEATLKISMPSGAGSEAIRRHKPFVQDKITIQSFSDHVLVLSSLQRPRKLTVRGSDGKQYGLLCKPKDDLRKDQRLMEFNGIINRALKRDAESSKRRLYIKTYAVTPLSEESGIIEWVEGIKPMRDILLGIYGRKGVRPNYPELRRLLDEASADVRNVNVFTDKVLPIFPACLHEWFTEVYPEPETWFAARLRYARSAAVMSILGHVLGLGDRHGENILLEESTGGVFHVDFNCLFDKGLTFEKPEVVPFRLTHNMVDAMGPYGYEGPFRKSSELTLRLLRQSKDTLMTVLETFLYDPTTDFVGKKKRSTDGVPETPPEILDSVDAKLKGLLRGETVPLGVEGYVDALIRDAVSPWNLARMYIGWCAFL